MYFTLGPSSPVIEMLEPVELGWNISWKSDVTSRQDSYTVVWLRNDTGKVLSNTTKENWLLINNLYSGASYEIKVYAISYGLESEPHSYFQTVGKIPISTSPPPSHSAFCYMMYIIILCVYFVLEINFFQQEQKLINMEFVLLNAHARSKVWQNPSMLNWGGGIASFH